MNHSQQVPLSAGSRSTAALSVAGQSAQHLSGFVISLLAAGFLGVADYGVYTLSIVFVECVVMLTYTGFYHFVVTSEAEDAAVLPTMFWVMMGIGTLGGAAMFLCAHPISVFFETPEFAPVLRLFGILQPFASGISWAAAQLTRAGLMRRYFLIMIVANVFAVVAGGALLVLWQSLYALVAYRAVRILFSLCLFAFAVPRRPSQRFDVPLFRRAARYAVGLYGARGLTFLSTFGADLVLAYVFSTAEAGLYRFANRLATAAVDIIAQPLRHLSLKSFGQAARAALPLTPVFTAFFLGTAFLVGGFALTVVLLGPNFIGAVFRPEYVLAAGAVQALALRAAARLGQNMIEPSFSATQRTQVAFYHNLILTSAMLAVIATAAPLGVIPLAWAQAGLQLLSIPFSLWVLARFSPINVWPALASVGNVIALLGLYGGALWAVASLVVAQAPGSVAALAQALVAAAGLGVLTTWLAVRRGVPLAEIFSEREAIHAKSDV